LKSRAVSIVVCTLLAATAQGFPPGLESDPRGQSESAGEVHFLVRPYLQLGDALPGKRNGDLSLLWQTDEADAGWAVEYQPGPNAGWREAPVPSARTIAVPSIAPHLLYRTTLNSLERGSMFDYRVRRNGTVVFNAAGRAPQRAGQRYRFAAFGDCGALTEAQKRVAYQAYVAKPDFVMITGDIVYTRGRISEYREKFWPVYNSDEASPLVGAPLLRSTLFVAAAGNHDIGSRDLGKYPDGLAYFLYWDQPLNGPVAPEGSALFPRLAGPVANQQAFRASTGGSYPRMANFSFDFGGAHWMVLDSNEYVNWTDQKLRDWVARDLEAAANAPWRFVAFHHPGFNSSKAHANDQQMRVLAELFEAKGVDIVFTGHVHNYQRTFPLRFTAEVGPDGRAVRDALDRVPGRWVLNHEFDGRTHTKARGVIYLITGAGGNRLYNPEQQDQPSSWQTFTHKFISKVNSFTIVDVDGNSLTARQLSDTGEELDRFVVSK
jgi:hypothetical protein